MDGWRPGLRWTLSKTEFIYFGNAKQLQKCTSDSINVAGDLILRSEVIRYLGIWLDSALNFKTHVTKKCKAAMLNFLRIRGIHHLLTEEATSSLVLSLCVSHLDYCNSVLYRSPRHHHQPIAENTEHVCTLSVKKTQMGQCIDSLPCIPPLATNQAMHNFQDMCAYI